MTQNAKQTRPKILLVDDDPAVLEPYRDLLAQLPTKPEVFVAATGARAMGLLKTETFRLMICDLVMPKMDGLQLLSIVRRRFPELRTVALTGAADEQLRARAYALGIDMFWVKPDTRGNMEMFLQCIESLLGREDEGGFRGIQSKGLMDIIQMESLSQSSTVLRITRGALVGKLWFNSGDLVDAETNDGVRGEPAFRQILGWKSGTFENLPAEPQRERNITKPLNALLLETAQVIDEIAAPLEGHSPEAAEEAGHRKNVLRLAAMTREGADFVVSLPDDQPKKAEAWGTEATELLSGWMGAAVEVWHKLGQRLEAGPFAHLEGRALDHRLVLLPHEGSTFLVGWPQDAEPEHLTERSKRLVATWGS
ncbi:MAG TPA: response regulator [Verrucomicrobiae bacterium]|nr:response regulator [Verrucomicrobiae bacterium]